MVSFHWHANAGTSATSNIIVDENGSTAHGRDAFVAFITSQKADHGAFPEKLFHDFDVFVDGKLGVVEFVWRGPQQSKYMDVDVK